MIRTVTAFCIAAALFAAGATLWAEPNPPQESSSSPRNVKVTGCVGKDDKGVFMLTNSKVEPAAGAGTLPDSLRAVATFQLEGSGLEPHISHKVEIDGSAVAPPPPPAATTSTPAPAAAPVRATPPPPTKLTVKAVKHIHTYPCF
jgi:hypothetical protein